MAFLSRVAAVAALFAFSCSNAARADFQSNVATRQLQRSTPVVKSVFPGERIRPSSLHAEPDVTLRIGIVSDPPFIVVDGSTGAMSGINIQLFHGLVEELSVDHTLNTTYESVLVPFRSYQEALAGLFNGSIDMTGFALDAGLSSQVTFSVPFYVMQFVMTTLQRQEHAHTWVVLQPFTLGTWTLVGLFVLAMGFLFFFADACSPVGSRGRDEMFCGSCCVGSFGRRVRRQQLALAAARASIGATASSPTAVAAGALSPSVAATLAQEAADSADACRGGLRGGGACPVGAPVEGAAMGDSGGAAEGAASPTALATITAAHGSAGKPGGGGGDGHGHDGDGHGGGHSGGGHAAKPLGLVSTLFDTLVFSLEFEYEHHFPRSSSMRFLSIAARTVVLFLLASYESSLNAIEVGLQANNPQLDLTELQQQQLPWGVLGVAAPRFVRSAQFSLRQMARPGQMNTFLTNAEQLSALRRGEIQAVLSLDQSMRYAAARASVTAGSCDLSVDQSVSLNTAQLALCMPLARKGSPFLAAVNHAILTIRASQELTEVCDAVIRAAGNCPVPEASSSGGVMTEASMEEEGGAGVAEQVHISSVAGAFYIAGGILALAIAVHIVTAYPPPCCRSLCTERGWCSRAGFVAPRHRTLSRASGTPSAAGLKRHSAATGGAYLSLPEADVPVDAVPAATVTAVAANPLRLAAASAH